jgi:hypothetical protein
VPSPRSATQQLHARKQRSSEAQSSAQSAAPAVSGRSNGTSWVLPVLVIISARSNQKGGRGSCFPCDGKVVSFVSSFVASPARPFGVGGRSAPVRLVFLDPIELMGRGRMVGWIVNLVKMKDSRGTARMISVKTHVFQVAPMSWG